MLNAAVPIHTYHIIETDLHYWYLFYIEPETLPQKSFIKLA